MSSLSLDNDSNQADFVLKLRLVGVGGSPQIRRVRLHRIQVDGKISYPALVNVAIKCTFPNAPLKAEEFEVGLTYYDIDNDCITIACTEELIDAIDQFSSIDRPVLKITTDVKRKEGLPEPQEVSSRAAAPKVTSEAIASSSPTGKQAHLPHLVESFVAVLSKALEALQKQLAEVNQNNMETPAPASAPKKEESAEELAKAVVNNMEMAKAKKAMPKQDEGKKETKEPPSVPERPFIHGRHTCNGCLCTPIIGTRYHATNLVDYDLCAKCKDNYQGTEISFEAVELDRDRPFQERWHRKRERFANRGACRPNGRGPGHRGFGHRHGPCRGPNSRRGPPFRWQHDGMDKAFEEAVRRSLQDVQPQATTKAAPSAPVDESKSSKFADASPSSDADNASNGTVDISDDVVTPKEDKSEKLDEEISNETEEEETKKSEDATAADEGRVTSATEKTANSSFSSDAAGHGDAAEKLGKTLDECAQAIDAMVTELDRSSPDAADDEASDAGELPVAAVVETTTETEASAGEKIVDGEDVEEEGKGSISSEEEWQVVAEDDQVASDEMIARAAQLIGSSLFQSDLRNSEACEATFSTLSNSGNVGGDESVLSVPSSVPSVASGISPAVLDRWAFQLAHLHELGFDDDARNIEVLEHLTAAKIGVDDDDEVSVTHVVNALLKN